MLHLGVPWGPLYNPGSPTCHAWEVLIPSAFPPACSGSCRRICKQLPRCECVMGPPTWPQPVPMPPWWYMLPWEKLIKKFSMWEKWIWDDLAFVRHNKKDSGREKHTYSAFQNSSDAAFIFPIFAPYWITKSSFWLVHTSTNNTRSTSIFEAIWTFWLVGYWSTELTIFLF